VKGGAEKSKAIKLPLVRKGGKEGSKFLANTSAGRDSPQHRKGGWKKEGIRGILLKWREERGCEERRACKKRIAKKRRKHFPEKFLIKRRVEKVE